MSSDPQLLCDLSSSQFPRISFDIGNSREAADEASSQLPWDLQTGGDWDPRVAVIKETHQLPWDLQTRGDWDPRVAVIKETHQLPWDWSTVQVDHLIKIFRLYLSL